MPASPQTEAAPALTGVPTCTPTLYKRGPLMSHVSASEHNRSDAVPSRGDGDPSLTQVCKQQRMHQQKRMHEIRERESCLFKRDSEHL